MLFMVFIGYKRFWRGGRGRVCLGSGIFLEGNF